MIKNIGYLLLGVLFFSACTKAPVKNNENEIFPFLQVSENGRFIQKDNGDPFFWLGDTGWLLFTKLNKEDAEAYFDNRSAKGFNVLQVSAIHMLDAKNVYGDSALINKNLAKPLLIDDKYDYWDHVDYLVDLAAEKGLYMALVPVWGNNVKNGGVSYNEAEDYASFLAERYGDKPNVLWLNGGDTFGSDSTATWNVIGRTLKENAPKQLVTFHPRGRCASSDWFHNVDWLDFNMIQSGHRNYEQDDTERGYGQDNWRFVADDYAMEPVKPIIDGEPSYEDIPIGLHDPAFGYWDHNDVRRYAYWSVFAGAFGFTYGHNAIMQFYKRTDGTPAFAAKDYWDIALNSPGSYQIHYLKDLMLSRSFFDRVPAQELLAENGEKYDYKVATKGGNYAMVYTYRGGTIKVDLDKMNAEKVAVSWFNPRTGALQKTGEIKAAGVREFQTPVIVDMDGNDWVLILDKIS
jgi:hypothetical protein